MPEEYGKILRKQKEYDALVKEQYDWHTKNGNKWFTAEIADEYQKKYRALLQVGKKEMEVRMVLCRDLKNIYGLTEVEATNVLKGYHVQDYVSKYERIRKQIPIIRKERKEYSSEEEEWDEHY